MSYQNCPHCRASNRSVDLTCYSCSKSLKTEPASNPEDFLLEAPSLLGGTSEIGNVPAGKPLGAIAFSLIVGAGFGVALELLAQELTLELHAVLLSVLVASLTAVFLTYWADLPPGTGMARALPAALLGGLVGIYLAGVCFAFAPDLSPWTFGAIAGFFAGTPIMVSFGFAGGESRPLGLSELKNFGIDLIGAILLGGLLALETGIELIPGMVGGLALAMMIFGGRVNMWQITRALDRMKGSD